MDREQPPKEKPVSKQQEEAQKHVWDRLWSAPISYAWDSLSDTVYRALLDIAGPVAGKQVLEAGSGTGKISLRLSMDGAFVTLVDYSPQALEQSRLAFRQKNRDGQAEWVQADIREVPLPGGGYDLCWSAGVLEHFSLEEQVRILQEMRRLTKPGGQVAVLVPYSRCLPYRLGKSYAEAAGTWRYGTEIPIDSLREAFRQAEIEVELETDIGFVQSLDFLDFIPGAEVVKQWAASWYKTLEEKERKEAFPGYLLLTAGTVNPSD